MNLDKYKLVNWQPSMGVTEEHLRQTENYFIERLGDNLSTRITKYNYGLLPAEDRRKSATEFTISESITGNVEVVLKTCNAITAGGYRIAYNPSNGEYLRYDHIVETKDSANTESSYWDVVLSINPFDRLPEGMPDENENPPRHPYAMESYKLTLSPRGNTSYEQLGKYHLVIGRVRKYSGRYEVDNNYIPPCTSMSSHPDLYVYLDQFGRCMNDIERSSKVIIAKIRNRSQNAPLAFHIAAICEEIMRSISQFYFNFRNMGTDLLPIEVASYFSSLANATFISLNFTSKIEKEEVLKYFYEWSDVTPGSFEELLSNTLSILYSHTDIRAVMLQLESFLQIMSQLWNRLSALEYIGQHKDNIVISERLYQNESKKKETGGWTILD